MRLVRNLRAAIALTIFWAVCPDYALGQPVTLLDRQAPEYSDFQTAAYSGRIAPPKLSRDEEVQNFRTRILAAAGKAPNFGGLYHLLAWGCGAGCRMGALINVKSGQVFMVPHAVAGSFEYRLDSRLLVISGVRDESEDDDDADRHYYEVSGSKFLYLGTVRR